MNVYAFPSLLASYACFLFATLIYKKDPKNELNRIFALLCVALGIMTLAEFGARQAPDSAAAFPWFKLGAVWPFIIVFLVHFVLIFTRKSSLLRNKMTYFLLYVPGIIFLIIDLTTTLIAGAPRKVYWGWTYSVPENLVVYTISGIWAFSLAILSSTLCFLYLRRTKENIERQQAKYVFIWVSIPVVTGIITEGISPIIDLNIPELSYTASAIGVVFIMYAMWKYRLFELTPALAAEDMVASMSNFLFLVQKDGVISLTNQVALQLLRYDTSELIGKPLKCIFPEQEWEEIQEKLHSPVRPYPISNQETTVVTKEGRIIPVLVSISVVQDKEGNNLGLVCVGSDLTDHKQAEEAQRKEVLLKEIHHRVKNNMQIISSLLNLQSRYFRNEQDKEMIKESRNRIKSMALIHEKLYQSKDLARIDFSEYITDVAYGLLQSYGLDGIALKVEVDDITLGVDTAVPCGLMINELVSNSLKHAFPDKKGEIKIALHAVDGTIELTVRDNGIGIPEDINFRTAETLGLRLVTILAEDQLNGEITLSRTKGTEFLITFKEMK
jgi:PAS domain S-box-containing protein